MLWERSGNGEGQERRGVCRDVSAYVHDLHRSRFRLCRYFFHSKAFPSANLDSPQRPWRNVEHSLVNAPWCLISRLEKLCPSPRWPSRNVNQARGERNREAGLAPNQIYSILAEDESRVNERLMSWTANLNIRVMRRDPCLPWM